MKLRRQQKQWEHLAVQDPLWAILTDPAKKDRRWDTDEFFASGREEISRIQLPSARRSAFDFGCGVGRLTQALADHFEQVTGVDISAAMIAQAREYNRHGDRVRYVVNTENHLAQFPDDAFDFIYSRIVLQHLPPRHSRAYIREFVRILRPAGVALFQLPSASRARFRAGALLNQALTILRRDPHTMEMYGVPRATVLRDIEQAGGRLLETRPDHSAEPEWESFFYMVTK